MRLHDSGASRQCTQHYREASLRHIDSSGRSNNSKWLFLELCVVLKVVLGHFCNDFIIVVRGCLRRLHTRLFYFFLSVSFRFIVICMSRLYLRK